MHYSHAVQQAVGFLLGLTDEDTAGRVHDRTGLPTHEAHGPEAERRRRNRVWAWASRRIPASVVLWVLEEDDPDLRSLTWRFVGDDLGLRRALARGVPFGPDRTDPLPVPSRADGSEPPVPESYERLGLVGALRAAHTMTTARAAASMVLTRADWATVTDADAERPLPGYPRWALSVRPDCPRPLRAQFGSHPKFTHRLRQAGVLAGPAAYATAHAPAVDVLEVLSLGSFLFPARIGEAEEALRPLVAEHLGERDEAWAVLTQIVGTFHGTVPELVVTAGAIA